MSTKFKILVILLINSALLNSVRSICDQVYNYCDCDEINIDFYYRIHCPQKTLVKSKYNLEITVHSTNFEINCFDHNQTNFLVDLFANFDTTSFNLHLKHFFIINCFKNNTDIVLIQLLHNLNVKYLETLTIKSADLITIDDENFFKFFNFNAVRVLHYENVTFTTWKYLGLMKNLNKLVLNNSNLKRSDLNILNLVKLTQLALLNNKELRLTKFINFTNLQILSLTDNGFERIDEPILKNLKFLKSFSIDDDNLVEIMDDAKLFENNKIISHLAISNKRKLLTRLPNDLLHELKVLKRIFINCGIKEIDQYFFKELKETTMLLLHDNYLEHLPEKLFYDLHNLGILDLSGNRLKELPKNIFFKNTQLTTLDLSHNQLLDLSDTYMLQSLVGLTDLSLRYNELVNFTIDLQDLRHLQKIYLDHNNLTFENITGCPITGLINIDDLMVDLSWNMIFNLTDIKCLLQSQSIAKLKLNGNSVTELLSSQFHFIPPLNSLVTKYVELDSNDIVTIEFLDANVDYPLDSSEYQYYDDITVTYSVSISNNPIVCRDCENLLHDDILLETKVDGVYITLTKDDQECTVATDCSLETYFADEFDCPTFCYCSLIKLNQELLISCAGQNLRELPTLADVPIHYDKINLDISNNSIVFLNFSHFSTPIMRKMNKINAENNQIDSIEFYHEPTNLTSFKLASNNLKYLNSSVMHMLLDLNVELSIKNNPWHCDLNTFNFYVLKSLSRNEIADGTEVTCTAVETLQQEIKRMMALGLIVFLIAIAIIGFGILYLCRNKYYFRKYFIVRERCSELDLNETILE